MNLSRTEAVALNAICPYFTMFPLEFPLKILAKGASKGDSVLDPFCGRGTTNFAARLVGLSSLGVDSSPVAAAITAAKLVWVESSAVVAEATRIVADSQPIVIPNGEFWSWAYQSDVLEAICRFRSAFLADCGTAARIALRGLILGALHGPRQKHYPSYFSNQCPRTFSPKPAYAIRFWRERGMQPERFDVLAIIERRAKHYYKILPCIDGVARLADSRQPFSLSPNMPDARFNWVITSPPYYGMRTYLPDQWLRNWFVGGPETVDYSNHHQISHSNPEKFVDELRIVWQNAANVCVETATMVVRFGSIPDRQVNSLDLIKRSLADSGWSIQKIRAAGTATQGRRQADAFLRSRTKPMLENDIWATRC